jgi:hypothetical protein
MVAFETSEKREDSERPSRSSVLIASLLDVGRHVLGLHELLVPLLCRGNNKEIYLKMYESMHSIKETNTTLASVVIYSVHKTQDYLNW